MATTEGTTTSALCACRSRHPSTSRSSALSTPPTDSMAARSTTMHAGGRTGTRTGAVPLSLRGTRIRRRWAAATPLRRRQGHGLSSPADAPPRRRRRSRAADRRRRCPRVPHRQGGRATPQSTAPPRPRGSTPAHSPPRAVPGRRLAPARQRCVAGQPAATARRAAPEPRIGNATAHRRDHPVEGDNQPDGSRPGNASRHVVQAVHLAVTVPAATARPYSGRPATGRDVMSDPHERPWMAAPPLGGCSARPPAAGPQGCRRQ